jgi:hypothetical protein
MTNNDECPILNKFKKDILDMIFENELTINTAIDDNSNQENDEKIKKFINKYIKDTLTKKEKNIILINYGFSRAIKLYHDFQKVAINSSNDQICYNLSTDDNGIDDEIIEIIINVEIGFHTDWYKCGETSAMDLYF